MIHFGTAKLGPVTNFQLFAPKKKDACPNSTTRNHTRTQRIISHLIFIASGKDTDQSGLYFIAITSGRSESQSCCYFKPLGNRSRSEPLSKFRIFQIVVVSGEATFCFSRQSLFLPHLVKIKAHYK